MQPPTPVEKLGRNVHLENVLFADRQEAYSDKAYGQKKSTGVPNSEHELFLFGIKETAKIALSADLKSRPCTATRSSAPLANIFTRGHSEKAFYDFQLNHLLWLLGKDWFEDDYPSCMVSSFCCVPSLTRLDYPIHVRLGIAKTHDRKGCQPGLLRRFAANLEVSHSAKTMSSHVSSTSFHMFSFRD